MSDKPPGELARSRHGSGPISHRRRAQFSAERASAKTPPALTLGYFLLIACAVAGIALACQSAKDVSNGMIITGGALLAAAGARLVLPEHLAGLLATRRRVLDTMTFGLLGAGLLAIGLLLPPP